MTGTIRRKTLHHRDEVIWMRCGMCFWSDPKVNWRDPTTCSWREQGIRSGLSSPSLKRLSHHKQLSTLYLCAFVVLVLSSYFWGLNFDHVIHQLILSVEPKVCQCVWAIASTLTVVFLCVHDRCVGACAVGVWFGDWDVGWSWVHNGNFWFTAD